MTADARGAFDGEANGQGILGLGRKINVLAGDLGRAIVVERQQIDLVGNHGFWDHDEGRREGRKLPELLGPGSYTG